MPKLAKHPFFKTVYPRLVLLCAIPGLLALPALFFSLPLAVGLLILDILLFQSVFLALYGMHRVKQERESLMSFRQFEARLQLQEWLKPRLPLPGMRGGASSPDGLLVLCKIMLQQAPHNIVECGAGSSTLVLGYLAQSLGRGHVTTLEHNAEWHARVTQWVIDHELQEYVTVVHAPLAVQNGPEGTFTWYAPAAVEAALQGRIPIDLLFIDGPPISATLPLARYPALWQLGPHMAPQGSVVLDDTERPGEAQLARDWQTKYGVTLEWIPSERGTAVLSSRSQTALQ